MQNFAHAVQREIEHIVIFEIPPHLRHDHSGLAVFALRGLCLRSAFFRVFRDFRRFRLRGQLGRSGQFFQLPLRLDLPHGPPDGGFQLVGVHRLEEVIAGSQMHGLVGVLEQAVGLSLLHI